MNVARKPGHVLEIMRTFAAPRELVFQAWITAEMVQNWWGCNEFPASQVEMDARPGGSWRACLRANDGAEIWLGGRFIEIVRPERLVFTFIREASPVDTTVTIIFTEQAGKTMMRFRQEYFTTAELRDSHENGWTTGLGRLDKIFAAQPA